MTRPLSKSSPADGATLALHLDARAKEPLHHQLSRQLRHLILAGRITAAARLPSSRALATDLGVSRATIVLAFDQLASEGYIEGRHGSGMFVAAGLPEPSHDLDQPLASATARPEKLPARTAPRPFQLGATDASLFPYRHWARLLYRTWREPEADLTGTIDSFGWPDLRQAIARHLGEWRGIACKAHQIVVTGGTPDATELIARVAFPPGAAVYVEEPGYPTLRHNLIALGHVVRPVPVDDDGLSIERARQLGRASAAIVTPSRQFPLGATLPLARRLELLEWASTVGGFVVEDDFDSEYRYAGAPLPALMSLDRNGRTIYIGSFSKVLSPALRLGFIVLPEHLVAAARRHLANRGTLASLVAQPALATFIAEGDYARHIRRTRRLYARRMSAVIDARQRLTGLLDLTPSNAGMHIVAGLAPPLARRMTDREAAERAGNAGLAVTPLSSFYAMKPRRAGLLLGFAGFPETTLKSAVTRLARALTD